MHHRINQGPAMDGSNNKTITPCWEHYYPPEVFESNTSSSPRLRPSDRFVTVAAAPVKAIIRDAVMHII